MNLLHIHLYGIIIMTDKQNVKTDIGDIITDILNGERGLKPVIDFNERAMTLLDKPISVIELYDKDYLSLTDIVAGDDKGEYLLDVWLSAQSTVKRVIAWEKEHYPKNFNEEAAIELSRLININTFSLADPRWHELTEGFGIVSMERWHGVSGRFVYAQESLAKEFYLWYLAWHNRKDDEIPDDIIRMALSATLGVDIDSCKDGYFALSGLVSHIDGWRYLIDAWFRKPETQDYLHNWELKHNKEYDKVVAEHIRKNELMITPYRWIATVNSLGMTATSPSNIYVVKPIFLDFCTSELPGALSKVLLAIQRLLDDED